MGLSGLEPPTSRLSGVRSNRLSYKPISWFERWFPTLPFASRFRFLQSGRLCISTSLCLPELPSAGLVEMNGIEPMTPCLQSRCSPS